MRINELARELEVKARAILDYLPEIGIEDKKSYSDSISQEVAEKVRAHFRPHVDLEAVLEEHRRWVNSNGKEGQRANLTSADLSRSDLSGAYLNGAELIRANRPW